MQGARKKDLEALRLKIAALETGPVLAGTALSPGRKQAALLDVPSGTLSEIFADQHRESGAALGFALGLARGQLTETRQGLIYLQLVEDAQELGVPYGNGLAHFGIAPDRLVVARPKTIVELLWAMEEAIACRAVAAVVADIGGRHKALDFTASRRLSLRSAGAGTSTFLVRYARDREASAAKYRWKLSPALSGPKPFDPRAPGPPRWRAVLEKGRLRPGKPSSAEGEYYLLDWTNNGFALADTEGRDAELAGGRSALSRPQPAALGDRLSQAS